MGEDITLASTSDVVNTLGRNAVHKPQDVEYEHLAYRERLSEILYAKIQSLGAEVALGRKSVDAAAAELASFGIELFRG